MRFCIVGSRRLTASIVSLTMLGIPTRSASRRVAVGA